ncbi:HAD family hydrolase [Chromatocurvus halotolerans]|uniref:Histidinol-phosphatase n=1 Tax=Chromatocurvus halotolerans TaxID=1132028 RepID=A0A4R2KRH7_9GAMM|nr:HAD family hydrolase [Chromatocurvus halotolerans]TCO75347.1 HAD superfamily hydrolase (TIGR01490 family) [Chromatocurvus halotolerans]
MPLAIFDLDDTLLAGDSDHLWGAWLCEQGRVNAAAHASANEQFYADYKAGSLDIAAYLRFALRPIAGRSTGEIASWQAAFLQDKIAHIMLPQARALIDSHRQRGDTLLVITATNEVVAGPIVRQLGIDNLIACGVEVAEGRYTGAPTGTPSYREGKVVRLQDWLADKGESLTGATFYSDSHNDLPLLQLVDNPVAVDPDPTLAAHARDNGWRIISLRGA